MENKYTLENAQNYILNNKHSVDNTYKPKLHFTAEIGWINDPNGFSKYNDEYHLFYQYHPYSSTWGPMHWGHATSKDGVTWDHQPVALAPEDDIDNIGCFSGSAMEVNGEHVLIYTGVVNYNDDKDDIRQRQCIAYGDGITYNKKGHFIIKEESLPDNLVFRDFRDPKLFKHNDDFYCICGSKTTDKKGCLTLHKSKDLENWEFKSIMFTSDEANDGSTECPDFFQYDDKYILITSPQFKQVEEDRYFNLHSCTYSIGDMNFENGVFKEEYTGLIDYGFDYYAPQTLLDTDGRRIMISWLQMWDRTMPPNVQNHNWAGAMSIPREIKFVCNELFQSPIKELENYRTDEVVINEKIIGEYYNENLYGRYLDVEIEFYPQENSKFGIKFFVGDNEETVFYFDNKENRITFDRTNGGVLIEGNPKEVQGASVRHVNLELGEKVTARFIVDNTCIEAFLENGIRTMAGNVYSKETSNKVVIFSDKELEIKVKKYTLDV